MTFGIKLPKALIRRLCRFCKFAQKLCLTLIGFREGCKTCVRAAMAGTHLVDLISGQSPLDMVPGYYAIKVDITYLLLREMRLCQLLWICFK